ncbi:MAG TPA: HDOD domain-containing protein [Thiolapillus brandeum]|uniref:HDOD domain-containing protein n=1 Tax=Thiolapillus brandeum TaxID=1076588 RepID=A0A7C5IXV4_9GAMM|nr:HDOD domain-containing protein [Thiolapillus brandeum]
MIHCQPRDRDCLREVMAANQLPVLPPNAPYLLRAMSNEEMTFPELAAVVEKFPTIAARLIALANSGWSSPVTEVTSLVMACSRLGFFVVRSVSVALSIANVFNPRTCPAFDPIRYWTNAFLTADLGTRLAEQAEEHGEADPQTVRTAGLLHNLGLLWLATWMPEETHRALLASDDDPDTPLDGLLVEHCGAGFVEAGALLTEAWKFPEVLTEALRHQAEVDYDGEHWEAAALVGLAGRVIHAREEAEPLAASDPRWSRLGLSSEAEAPLAQQAALRRGEIRELARALFGA